MQGAVRGGETSFGQAGSSVESRLAGCCSSMLGRTSSLAVRVMAASVYTH